jgi:hypothetical protein
LSWCGLMRHGWSGVVNSDAKASMLDCG